MRVCGCDGSIPIYYQAGGWCLTPEHSQCTQGGRAVARERHDGGLRAAFLYYLHLLFPSQPSLNNHFQQNTKPAAWQTASSFIRARHGAMLALASGQRGGVKQPPSIFLSWLNTISPPAAVSLLLWAKDGLADKAFLAIPVSRSAHNISTYRGKPCC